MGGKGRTSKVEEGTRIDPQYQNEEQFEYEEER
jgi:hypothetical protein